MKHSLLCVLMSAVLLVLVGCSSVRLVPVAVENGSVNAADSTLTISRNGISVSIRPESATINAYNLDSTVSAFHVSISNGSSSEVSYTEESFVLSDEKGLQYNLLTPEKVRDMLKKDSYYLMPYPYVGFYYLEDFQKTSFYNKTNSSLPYYYELYPQDLFTASLPLSPVIPGMKIEGQVFFKIDLSAHQTVRLLIFRKGASRSNPPEFVFPFTVVK